VPILALPKVSARTRDKLLKDRRLCELRGFHHCYSQASIYCNICSASPVSDHVVGLWKENRQRVPKAIELEELRDDLS
jgi:hypothetical protein